MRRPEVVLVALGLDYRPEVVLVALGLDYRPAHQLRHRRPNRHYWRYYPYHRQSQDSPSSGPMK
jgi:hypothetical protein